MSITNDCDAWVRKHMAECKELDEVIMHEIILTDGRVIRIGPGFEESFCADGPAHKRRMVGVARCRACGATWRGEKVVDEREPPGETPR